MAFRRGGLGGGGPARRAFKRTLRRERRMRRRIRRRIARRIVVGSTVLLCLAGSTAAYKFRKEDLQKIETSAGKSAESMTEEELKAQMKKLGINKIELNSEDQQKVDQSDEQDGNFEEATGECPNCGEDFFAGARFCEKCGQKLN